MFICGSYNPYLHFLLEFYQPLIRFLSPNHTSHYCRLSNCSMAERLQIPINLCDCVDFVRFIILLGFIVPLIFISNKNSPRKANKRACGFGPSISSGSESLWAIMQGLVACGADNIITYLFCFKGSIAVSMHQNPHGEHGEREKNTVAQNTPSTCLLLHPQFHRHKRCRVMRVIMEELINLWPLRRFFARFLEGHFFCRLE